MASEFEITKFEYRVRSGVGIIGAWANRPLWYAAVKVGEGTVLFSRYDDEGKWFCDAHFGRAGFPHFSHGEGSRCCRKQVATGRLAEALDARKAAWGDQPPVKVCGVA